MMIWVMMMWNKRRGIMIMRREMRRIVSGNTTITTTMTMTDMMTDMACTHVH